MNRKTIAVISTLALSLVAGMTILRGSATKAAMAVCTVPGTHATIQAAVNDAGCSTINVAPGAYAENVTISRALTLNGAQAGNPFAGRIFGSAGESTVTGQTTIQAAGVTVDGFSLTNPGQSTGVLIKTAGDNGLITNNIIDTVGAVGLNANTQAVYLENGPDNVSVLGNRISNVTGILSSNGGIFIGDSTSANASLNILIQGNSISDISSVLRGAYAIHVNNGASSTPSATGYTTAQIRNNTISNLAGGGWTHAIGLEGDTPGVIVEDNSVTNVAAPGPDRIAVWFEDNPSFATGQVHNNNLDVTALAFGIAVQPTLPVGSLNGTCNWWGSAMGPTAASNPGGNGSQVSPKVTYKPWLISPAPGASCIGGNVATNKDQCKNDGWKTRVRADNTPFKNQGDCVSYTNNGK